MIRKLVSAAALAAFAAAPAYALGDAGFESGTTNDWSYTTGGTLELWTHNTQTMTVWNDYDLNGDGVADGDFTTAYNITAAAGNYFGVMYSDFGSTPTQAFTLNLTGPQSRPGDIFYMRLFSSEFVFPDHNDYGRVSFFGNGALLATDYISVQSNVTVASGGTGIDSGWRGFAAPIGTTAIAVDLFNVSLDGKNSPILAIDYAAAPVPEADVTAMMVVGLGALGFAARRRSRKLAA
ncbi:MAG: hypothetical protein RL456_1366 [Pseudomonadota bacterium]|jgi:hypothetical protein